MVAGAAKPGDKGKIGCPKNSSDLSKNSRSKVLEALVSSLTNSAATA